MKTITISESSQFVESPEHGDSMVVRVIREGEGSSGVYSRELLERSAGLFADCLSFVNHPVDGNPLGRTFLDVAGRLGESWFSDHEGFGAIYAEYTPVSRYADIVHELKDAIGLSIFTMGEASEDEDGTIVIESFAETDPYRSVDVVIAPGAGGSLTPVLNENRRVLESLAENEEEEDTMEQAIADLTEKVDALVASVEALVKDLTPEDEPEGENPVEAYAAAADAVDAADITESQKKSLKARALKGEDITEAIAEAVKVKAEIVEGMKVEGKVRVGESSKDAPFNPRTVKNWSK